MFKIEIFKNHNTDYVITLIEANTKEELLKEWKENFKLYEGYHYAIWNGNHNLIMGSYDDADMGYLEDYFQD